MDDELNELREQRKLIHKHLEWLDAKIAQKEGLTQAGNVTDPEPEAALDKTASPIKPSATPLAQQSPIPKQQSAPARTEAANTQASTTTNGPEESEIEDAPENYYPSNRGNDIQQAKLGCIVIFVGAMALFLFFLFGLPYLLD